MQMGRKGLRELTPAFGSARTGFPQTGLLHMLGSCVTIGRRSSTGHVGQELQLEEIL